MPTNKRGNGKRASKDSLAADNKSATGPGRSGQTIESPGRREERTDEIDTGTTDEDRNVDESPDAVERRREAQSGPGAPGTDADTTSRAEDEQARERRLAGKKEPDDPDEIGIDDGEVIGDEPPAPDDRDQLERRH
jgi:hypothetical protein